MELSSEDALRLNVLLAREPRAIRIDESSMTVLGLCDEGEARLSLNPTCREDQYLRMVREALSGHVLGSPGGYPVYLRRWTRMGQARDENLAELLKLGEPEAVAAVVHARGLTAELARRAWWAMPVTEHARVMLTRPEVVRSEMGPELARFLVEHLPFETEPAPMVETVRLVLQPGLVDADTRTGIWRRARHKSPFLVGFLMALPDGLPDPRPGRGDADALSQALQPLVDAGNPVAERLVYLAGSAGQTFLQVTGRALDRAADQDVVLLLFEAVRRHLASVRVEGAEPRDLEHLHEDSRARCAGPTGTGPLGHALGATLAKAPALAGQAAAMLTLARLDYAVVRPVFSRTTAVGSLMRRKLEPITGGIRALLTTLHDVPG